MNIMQCQARLYWRLIRKAMDRDDYYKDFTLANFRFIVVNSIDNPNPLVWLFDRSQAIGELNLGNHVMRDPEVIGKELTHYLQDKPSVPDGIAIVGLNNIAEWLEKA